MIKLFVSGFPLDINEVELAKLFMPYGDLKTIKLVRDKKTRICKGYGFIEVEDELSANNIISALNGETMGDRQLTVTIRDENQVSKPVYRKQSSFNPPNALIRKKRPRKM